MSTEINYMDWRQRLVKFEHQSGKLLFARDSLPAFPGTPGAAPSGVMHSHARDTGNCPSKKRPPAGKRPAGGRENVSYGTTTSPRGARTG